MSYTSRENEEMKYRVKIFLFLSEGIKYNANRIKYTAAKKKRKALRAERVEYQGH